MKKSLTQCDEIMIVGISVRTNNKNEMEPQKAKIGPLAEEYWKTGLAEKIPYRKDPGRTFSIYTEYESDERGEYTYFIGEEVTDVGELPEPFSALRIPAGQYQKFTTEPGVIPEVIINAWRQIWLMGEEEMGGKRAYKADFEIIDVKSVNPQSAVFDIYIGLK